MLLPPPLLFKMPFSDSLSQAVSVGELACRTNRGPDLNGTGVVLAASRCRKVGAARRIKNIQHTARYTEVAPDRSHSAELVDDLGLFFGAPMSNRGA